MFSFELFTRFSLTTGIVGLLSLVSMIVTGPSLAANLVRTSCLDHQNCGFEKGESTENDFTGWETLGRTSIQTGTYGSSPTEGQNQALVTTFSEQTEDIVAIANFLTIETDVLNNLGQVYEGSAIRTTFTANAGDVFRFDWNFLTETTNSRSFNDFAFVTISQTVEKLADTFSTFVNSSTPFRKETGFGTFSYTVQTAGTYTLGIGVVDVSDGAVESALLVDNVSLDSDSPTTSVPEPASVLGLLALGAFGVGSKLLRQK